LVRKNAIWQPCNYFFQPIKIFSVLGFPTDATFVVLSYLYVRPKMFCINASRSVYIFCVVRQSLRNRSLSICVARHDFVLCDTQFVFRVNTPLCSVEILCHFFHCFPLLHTDVCR
jgi:hypothetical protein